MKTLNVRLVIILLVAIPVLGGAVWGLHRLQVWRNAGFFIDRANDAARRAEKATTQDDSKAEVKHRLEEEEQLKWYVHFRPDDTDALQRLGLLQIDLGLDIRFRTEQPRFYAWGISNLEKALRQDPARPHARRKLVELYLGTRQYSDARQHLDVLLEESPNDGELLQLLGACQMGLDKNDDAATSFQAAINNAPEQVEPYHLLMRVLADPNRLNRPAEGDTQMKKMVEAMSESPRAHLLYGRYLYSLASFNSLEELRKRTILLEAMVPAVLDNAFRQVLDDLEPAEEDADAQMLAEKRAVLSEALKRALKAHNPDLSLDHPDALLLAAIRGVRMDTDDDAALADAEQGVLKTLESELEADDYKAVALAAERGMLSAAMKKALETFGNGKALVAATVHRVVDEAERHILRARELAALDLQVLSLEEKHFVVLDAMKRALQDEESAALRLTAKRAVLASALQKAAKSLDLSEDDPNARLLAERPEVLVDVMQLALRSRQLASATREALAEDDALSHVIQDAVQRIQSQLEATDVGAILLAAHCALAKRDPEKARQHLEQGIQAYPKNAGLYLTLAGIESQLGRSENAIAALERGIKPTESSVRLLWKTANLLADDRKTDRVEQILKEWPGDEKYTRDELRQVPRSATAAAFLQARVDFARGQWLPASQGFEKVRDRLGGWPFYLKEADFYLAKCHEQLGDSDEALAAYRRALGVDPNYAKARLGLFETSLKSIQESIRSGQVEEAKQAFEEAEKEYRRIAKQLSKPARGWMELARVRMRINLVTDQAQRDWGRVDLLLQQAALVDPESVEVVILRANVLAARAEEQESLAAKEESPERRKEAEGRAKALMSQAERMLENARTRTPEEARYWLALAGLAEMQEDWDRTETLHSEIEKGLGDNLLLRLSRARYFVRRYEKGALERLPALADDIESLPEPDRLKLLLQLSRMAQQQEGWELAGQLLGRAEQELGDSAVLRLARAQYLARRNEEGTSEQLRKLGENADHLSAADQQRLWLGLMSIAMQMRDDQQAAVFCRRLAKAAPNNLYIRALFFQIALRIGDESGIKEVLKEIEAIEGKGPHWLYGQAARLSFVAKGPDDKRLDEALDALDQAAKARPGWSRVPLLRGGVYARKGDWNSALENYLLAIQAGERNPYAIRQAIQLLERRQRYEEAGKLMSLLADQPTPSSPDFDRVRLRVLKSERKWDEALQLAETIAAESDHYRDHVEHGKLLSIKGRRAKRSGDAAEAERILADAEKALRHAVELSNKTADTWVALVHFLGTTGQKSKAEEAIEQARGKIPAERAHFLLGKYYVAIGQSGKAQKEFQEAMSAAPEDLEMLVSVADSLLTSAEAELAVPYLERIVDGSGKVGQAQLKWARRALAKLLIGRGDYPSQQRARDLIEENLAEAPISPEDQSIRASLLGAGPTRAQREQAIQALEGLANRTPSQQVELAALYQKQGNWPKARRTMQTLLGSPDAKPEHMVNYIGWLLERGELSDAELWVRKLENVAPPQFAIANFKAELLFRRKRYDQALDMVKQFIDQPNAQPADETVRSAWVAESLERFAWQLNGLGEKAEAQRFALEADSIYQKLTREDPRKELAYASFLARLGQIDKALDCTERGWRSGSPVALAKVCRRLLGSANASEQQIRRAETVVQAALEEFDQSVVLLLVMAEVRAAQRRYDDAENLYREVLKLDGNNSVALNNCAVLLAQRGIKLEESLRLIQRAIEQSGPVATMLDSRASVYIARGESDKALADLERANREKATPIRRFHQAQAYLQKGQRANAVAAMEKAVKLGLKPETLHPLELPTYRKLKAQLK